MTENEKLTIESLENQGIENNCTDEEYIIKNQLSFNFETEEETQEDKQEESIQDSIQSAIEEEKAIESSLIDEMPILLLESDEEENQGQESNQETASENNVIEDNVIEDESQEKTKQEETIQENMQEESIQESKEIQAIEESQEESQEKQAITFKSLFIRYSAYDNKYYQSDSYITKQIKKFLSKCLEMAIDSKNTSLELSIENYLNNNPGECVANATEKQIDTIKSKFNTLAKLASLLIYVDENSNYKFREKIDSFFVSTIEEKFFTFENDTDRTYFTNWQAIYQEVASFFQLFNDLFSYSEKTIDFDSQKTLESLDFQGLTMNEDNQNKTYGYAMITTHTQSIEMQEKHILKQFPNAKIYKETIKNNEQETFFKLLKKLKKGDTLVIDSITKLAINDATAFQNYKSLLDKEIEIVIIHETHLNTAFYYELLNRENTIDFDTVKSTILSVIENNINIAFSSFYDVKTKHARETAKGIATAKTKGRKAGVKLGASHPPKNKAKILKRIKALSSVFNGNLSDKQVCEKLKISRPTMIKYRRELYAMQEKA